MFVRFWLLWLLFGMAAAVWVFAWAIRTGQYSEERRAALLPLDDMVPERASHAHQGRFHMRLLIGLVAVGIALTIVTVLIASIPAVGEGQP